MKWVYFFSKYLIYVPIKLLYPTKMINRENFPKTKSILVSNHLSALDIVLEYLDLPGFRYTIAKSELNKNKFVGNYLKALGAIYVDREKADFAAVKNVLTVLKNGNSLSLFPEGTRNKHDESLQQIKEGAAMFAIRSKTPIVPVTVYNKAKIFRKNYTMVGEQFTLEQFYGSKLDPETLKKASEFVEGKMRALQSQLNDYVFYNKSKAGKKLVKESKKAANALGSFEW